MSVLNVQYDCFSSITNKMLEDVTHIHIFFDVANPKTQIANLLISRDNKGKIDGFCKLETYDSLKEFSTTSMKELLMLYAKRTVVANDREYFVTDDPRLHSFLSKLAYTGIETVCANLDEFAQQFKAGKVTLKLPRASFKPGKNKYTSDIMTIKE